MRLLKITLTNFQGIKALTLEPLGVSASIYGDNATGKTTIYNALTWLLFDKSSTGAKNFTPKTRGPEGDIHHLEHKVEATLEASDDRKVVLAKTFKEVYKKKRGAVHEEFSGHTVDYAIDGVPVKEKEYEAAVLDLCGGDAEKIKMLTMPDYFPAQMPWDDRRKILLEVCGDMDDDEVIESTPELQELPEHLKIPGTVDKYYTIDEYRKIAAARRKEINQQLTEIPARIDEASKGIPDVDGLDEKAIQSTISTMEAQVDQLIQRKADVISGDAASATIRQEIAELNIQVAEARAAHIQIQQDQGAAEREQIRDRQAEAAECQRKVEATLAEISRKNNDLGRIEGMRTQLIEEYKAVSAWAWSDKMAICPTCGQGAPEDQVDRMRAEFNQRKSERLAEINAHGKSEASKDAIAVLEREIERLKEQMKDYEAQQKQAAQEAERLKQNLPAPIQFEATEKAHLLHKRMQELTAKLADAGAQETAALEAVEGRIRDANEAIRAEQEKLLRLGEAERIRLRIAELEKEERLLAEEFEAIERGLYLCDVFTKTKVSALTERINGKFQNVRFRLFQDQLNGGVKEDCEVMIPTVDGRMVPYAFANNAARINAGLEIIGTLAEHWGISMPVFIDNAESVTKLNMPDGMQVIRLVVSKEDMDLRMVI